MPKAKSLFFCKECGFESAKWLGQCPSCKEWNTFVEAPAARTASSGGRSAGGRGNGARGISGAVQTGAGAAGRVQKLSEISLFQDERYHTGIGELDRVLGGGIVKDSLVLVGGDPGIGKSTLLLQMMQKLSRDGLQVLYVSGEESLTQIRMRADRIGSSDTDLNLLAETDLDLILAAIEETKPAVVVIDSIQTMFAPDVDATPGSISQVREVTSALLRLAKTMKISIFIVGHVTKEGTVAGPRMLEHMVDTVLYFEGEKVASYRILRAAKNRFGSTNEVGVFDMQQEGLVEVMNPSEYMLAGMPESAPGSIIACTVEGTRPIMVEVQALVCQTNFNLPRRTAAGTDYNRVNLLMAVLEKRLGLSLGSCDAYVNIAGGMRVSEPALDLAIVAAIMSSYRNRETADKVIAFGEVGLTGEIRGVNMAKARIDEAVKMHLPLLILPAVNAKGLPGAIPWPDGSGEMRLMGIRNVADLRELL